MGLQKYIGCLQESKRIFRRYSTFWVSLYGCLWVGVMELWHELVFELIRLKPQKLLNF